MITRKNSSRENIDFFGFNSTRGNVKKSSKYNKNSRNNIPMFGLSGSQTVKITKSNNSQFIPMFSPSVWPVARPYMKNHKYSPLASSLTIPQRPQVSMFAPVGVRPGAAIWGDSDGDGIMNGFDCAPFNKRKQGPEHEARAKKLYDKSTKILQTYLRSPRMPNKQESLGKKMDEVYPKAMKAKAVAEAKRNEQKEFPEVITTLSAKDEYKFQQGALVMKPEKRIKTMTINLGDVQPKEAERQAHNKQALAYNAGVLVGEDEPANEEDSMFGKAAMSPGPEDVEDSIIDEPQTARQRMNDRLYASHDED